MEVDGRWSLLRLHRRTHKHIVDIDVCRLCQAPHDGRRNVLGRQERDLGEARKAIEHVLVRDMRRQLGRHGAARDRRHAHSLARELGSQTLGPQRHEGLGSRVDRRSREDLAIGVGRDVDDVAAARRARERLERLGRRVHDALDVGVDHAIPLFDLDLVDEAQQHDAGVVDQDIEASKVCDRACNRMLSTSMS